MNVDEMSAESRGLPLARRPTVDRLSDLWLLLDEHFPGEHGEWRAFFIDDLYVDLLDRFIDDNGYQMCDECGGEM